MSDGAKFPVAILGGSGYVSGELLRLLAGHPRFEVRAALSTSQAGEPVTASFPHLAGTALDALRFGDPGAVQPLFESGREIGLFAATPHGTTGALVGALLDHADAVGARVRVVDLSADFRFRDPEAFAAIYGKSHGAPARCPAFACAVPEHFAGRPAAHAAQPGCFTTAVVLAAYPLFAAGLAAGEVFVSAVTGSSGSGRTPAANTHHPERRSTMYAYSPLAHRHEAEMRALLAPACGGEAPEVEFVPHSGPFVRGIHATLRVPLAQAASAADLAAAIDAFYAGSPFVSASPAPPKLTEVVGTNRCRIGVSVRGRTAVLLSVIDNLVKGAAGGGVQWMNRLFGLPDETGLVLPGIGWF